MAFPPVDRYDRLVGAGTLCPFDFTNNPEFFTIKPDARSIFSQQQRALSILKIHGVEAVTQDMRRIAFVRGPMSTGIRAVDYALDMEDHIRKTWASPTKKGRPVLTTQDLSKITPKSELVARVILPNINQNLDLAERTAHTFPDHAVWAPAFSEAVERLKASNFGVTLGASTPDWAFEEFYIPLIITRVSLMVAGLDHAHSRWANNEDLAATQTQMGFFEDVRDARSDPLFCVDVVGRKIALADRAWERARAIVYQAIKGFEYDVALASLAGEFQYHRWLKEGTRSSRLHPDLADRSREDIGRLDHLENLMLPLMANDRRFSQWVNWSCDADLKKYHEQNIYPLEGAKYDPHKAILEIAGYLPVGGFEYPSFEGIFKPKTGIENRAASLSALPLARPDMRRHSTQPYFAPRARIFEDHTFDDLNTSEREQGSLNYILSTFESARLPVQAPRALFLIAAIKGGENAKDFAAERGFDFIKEVQSVDGALYAKSVIERRRAQRESIVSALLSNQDIIKAGYSAIYGTHTVDYLTQILARYPEFNARDGERSLTSQAKLLAATEILDRHASGAVIPRGWQYDSDDIALTLRAFMIQMGLIERPSHGDQAGFVVLRQLQDGQFSPASVFDVLPDLLDRIESDLNVKAFHRETLVSTARLIHLFDLVDNPGHMNVTRIKDQKTGLTHQEQITDFANLTGVYGTHALGQHDKHLVLRQKILRIRRMIEDVGMIVFEEKDLVDLPDTYRNSWNNVQGALKKTARRVRQPGVLAYENLG